MASLLGEHLISFVISKEVSKSSLATF